MTLLGGAESGGVVEGPYQGELALRVGGGRETRLRAIDHLHSGASERSERGVGHRALMKKALGSGCEPGPGADGEEPLQPAKPSTTIRKTIPPGVLTMTLLMKRFTNQQAQRV